MARLGLTVLSGVERGVGSGAAAHARTASTTASLIAGAASTTALDRPERAQHGRHPRLAEHGQAHPAERRRRRAPGSVEARGELLGQRPSAGRLEAGMAK